MGFEDVNVVLKSVLISTGIDSKYALAIGIGGMVNAHMIDGIRKGKRSRAKFIGNLLIIVFLYSVQYNLLLWV